MTNKTMPTNIWISDINGSHCRCWGMPVYDDHNRQSEQYTLVHNNPDYHVIKKSDVDGDVIKKLKSIKENIISLFSTGRGIEMTEFCVPLELDEVINALITQSKPPVVDGDVMGALDALIYCIDCMSDHNKNEEGVAVWTNGNFADRPLTLGKLKVLRNALIAQSDPSMVRIPRMLAESALECIQAYDSVEWNDDCEGDNYSETICELEKLLNYTEGE